MYCQTTVYIQREYTGWVVVSPPDRLATWNEMDVPSFLLLLLLLHSSTETSADWYDCTTNGEGTSEQKSKAAASIHTHTHTGREEKLRSERWSQTPTRCGSIGKILNVHELNTNTDEHRGISRYDMMGHWMTAHQLLPRTVCSSSQEHTRRSSTARVEVTNVLVLVCSSIDWFGIARWI